jgi:hypothetical protein
MERKKVLKQVQYERFGIDYVAGRSVAHLHVQGRIKTQCGLYRLGLMVKSNGGPPVCRNCVKTVKIVEQFGKKVAIFKITDAVVSVVERR